MSSVHWAVPLIPAINFILVGRLAAGGPSSTAFAAVAGMTSAALTRALLAVMEAGIAANAPGPAKVRPQQAPQKISCMPQIEKESARVSKQ